MHGVSLYSNPTSDHSLSPPTLFLPTAPNGLCTRSGGPYLRASTELLGLGGNGLICSVGNDSSASTSHKDAVIYGRPPEMTYTDCRELDHGVFGCPPRTVLYEQLTLLSKGNAPFVVVAE
ncbi:hypothetical protein PT974_00999 [Cladobotryum mycophilum]|uniref:Uncharacterized protein n=1 Tax=Cladobotryum mycophilum TaxID=491253 RepID=A0ABR0T2E8_9HYPO